MWGPDLNEEMRFAAAPTSLLICDAAVEVAGSVISLIPDHSAPYIHQLLQNITQTHNMLKSKNAKKREQQNQLRVCIRDLSRNAAGVVLKALKESVAEGRTIADQALLTKIMDLLSTLLLEDSAIIRCAAAESFGFLARATVGHYRESCINFLLECMRNPKREPFVRGSFAFAIGCICRYTNDLWHPYIHDVVNALQGGNQLPMPDVRVWTLYATSLMLKSAGGLATEFLPSLFKQLQVAIDGAEDLRGERDAKVNYRMPTYVSLIRVLSSTAVVIASAEEQGRTNDAIVAVAADLVGQITEVCQYTGVQAESAEMIGVVMGAPGEIMADVQTKVTTALRVSAFEMFTELLRSLRSEVRCAAAQALLLYAKTEAGRNSFSSKAIVTIRLLQALFSFLDYESEARGDATSSAQSVILIITRVLALEHSLELLSCLRLVASGQSFAAMIPDEEAAAEASSFMDSTSPAMKVSPPRTEVGAPRRRLHSKMGIVGHWKARSLSVDCVRTILSTLQGQKEHFDLKYAQEHPETKLLVTRLSDLIGIASTAILGVYHSHQIAGLRLMKAIVACFAASEDPFMPGSALLQQYQAQIIAAVRGVFPSVDDESDADATTRLPLPKAVTEGVETVQDYLTRNIIPPNDKLALRRLFNLLMLPLTDRAVLGRYTGDGCYDDVTESRIAVQLYAAVANLYAKYSAGGEPHPILANANASIDQLSG
eukprot:SAG11_NODE_1478_length_4837_cov_1.608485_5_plen_713_part_00